MGHSFPLVSLWFCFSSQSLRLVFYRLSTLPVGMGCLLIALATDSPWKPGSILPI